MLFLHAALSLRLQKLLPTDCQRRGVGLWTGVCPLPWLLASKIKQPFLSTNLAFLLAFERQAAGAPLSVTLGLPFWHCSKLDSLKNPPYKRHLEMLDKIQRYSEGVFGLIRKLRKSPVALN